MKLGILQIQICSKTRAFLNYWERLFSVLVATMPGLNQGWSGRGIYRFKSQLHSDSNWSIHGAVWSTYEYN